MSSEPAEPTFYFRAATREGGIFSGSLQARSAGSASRQLSEKGFQPLRVETAPIRMSWLHSEIGFGASSVLSLADSELICRELALLLGAGVPIDDALAIAAGSMPRGSRTGRFLALTRHGMRLGRSLSAAMELTGFRLPANLLSVVRAGEDTGALARCLSLLGDNLRESLRFGRALSAALAYPALLLAVSVMVFGLMAFFVAPSLGSLFASMGKPVPTTIAVLSGLAGFVESHLVAIGLACAVLITMLWAGGAAGLGRNVRRIGIRLPIAGAAMQWAATRQFAATLHLYLTSGLPVAVALPNALNAAGLPVSPARLQTVTDSVRTGSSLGAALQRFGLFPAKFVHMLEIGESSGRLADVLASAAAEARAKAEQRLALISALLAPILILVIGGLVGAVIFSVFSSLLQINELVA